MMFLVDNELDRIVSITADDEDTSNPVTNVTIRRLADYWQTNSAGTKTATIELTNSVQIKHISLVDHNLVSGDTVTIQAFDNSGYTGTPEELELTVRDGVIYGYKADFTATKYFKIVIAKNSGSYFSLGYLFISPNAFEADHLTGSRPNLESNTIDAESVGFQSYYSEGVSRKVQDFNFGVLTNANAQAFIIARDYIKKPGVLFQNKNRPDLNEPYFAKLESAKFDSRDYLRYPFTFSFKEVF